MAIIDLSVRDNLSAGADAATASLNKLMDAADKVSTSTGNLSQNTQKVGASFDTLNKKIDDNAYLTARMATINATYTASVSTLNTAFNSGAISLDQYTQKLAAVGVMRDQDSQKAQNQAKNIAAQYSVAVSSIDAAAAAQVKYNAALGVQPTSKSDYAARAQDIEAYGNSLDELRAKYNPLYAAAKAYDDEQKSITNARKVGAISIAEEQDALARAGRAYSDTNARLKETPGHLDNASHASAGFTRELIVMGHEISQGNFSRLGGSMLVLTERSQTLTGIVQNMGSLLLGWPGIFLAAGIAVVALGVHEAALEAESRTLVTALNGVGSSAGTTVKQLEQYATTLSRTSELSKSDAVAAVAAIQRTPNLTTADKQTITTLAPDVGAALGTGTTAAVKSLTDAYAGNWDAIKKLMASTNDFTLAQVTQVRQFLEVGDKANALKVITDQLNTSMKNARTDSLSPMEEAFHELGNGWNDFADRVARSKPVIAVMEAFRQATLGWADLLKNDTRDVSVQIAELNKQSLQIQDYLAKLKSHNQSDPAQEKVLADTNAQIEALIAKSKTAAEAVQTVGKALTASGGTNTTTTSDSKTDASGRTTAQAIALDQYNKSLKNQNELLATSVTRRAAVAAGQQAYDNALASGLNIDDAKAIRQETIATAMRQAGDAAGLESAAMDRATGYAIKMTAAIDAGSGAQYVAAAAAEAHEKATTQAGVSEAQYTKILLQRKAAEAISVQAQTNQDLTTQLSLAQKVLDTTDAKAAHEQELTNKVTLTTKAMTEQAQVSGNPALIAQAKAKVDTQIELNKQIDQTNIKLNNKAAVEQIDLETAAQLRISAAWDGSATSLTHLMNLEKARAANQYITNDDEKTAAINRMTTSLDAGSAASQKLSQQQASVSALSGAFSQAFSTIGDAITQAFVSGQGAAVNWSNVVKSVISQVIQKAAELAILNPILNSVFNQNLPTLGSALTTLGGGGGGATSGGSSGSGMFGNLFNLASTGNSVSGALGGPSFSSFASQAGNYVGLTGPGGLFYGGMDAAASAPLAAGVSGPVASAADVAASPGLFGGTVMGAGLGSWAGGVGGGFAVGSMVGGMVQSGLNKTGPAPMIGAGLGALGGAAIGTMILPGIGTVLGGLIGGTVGGAGGGLIGPHIASPYSSTGLEAINGQLQIGKTVSQKYDPSSDVAQLTAQVAQLNSTMAANNLSISGKYVQIGQNTPGGYQDPTKFGNLDAAINNYSVTSTTDANFNDKITKAFTNGYGSVQTLIDWINKYNAAQIASAQYVANTETTITTLNKTNGSLNDTIAQINTSFNASIDAGNQIIATGDLSTDQTNSMIDAENKLATARDKAVQAAKDAADAQDAATRTGLQSRYYNAQAALDNDPSEAQSAKLYAFDYNADQEKAQYKASLIALYGDTITTTEQYASDMLAEEKTLGEERLQIVKEYNDQIAAQFGQIVSFDSDLGVRFRTAQAAISGDPSQVNSANLFAFDTNAQTQRDAFSKQLTDLYGISFKTTSSYAAQMAGLEMTLGEERLQIVTQYNQQIADAQKQASGAAADMIKSITSFVTNLEGADSPLSPMAQLSLQETTFDKDSAASKAGDFNATSRLTSDATNLLNASKAVYGTGSDYIADYQKVLDTLSSVAATSPDALTASAFATETQTQTQTLVDSLAQLQAELVAIKLTLKQGSSTPVQLRY